MSVKESIQEVRFQNAIRIAEFINKKIDDGWRIFESENNRVKGFLIHEKEVIADTEDGMVIYFLNDNNFDDGAQTKIEDYNDSFKDWTMLQPQYIEKLILPKYPNKA